MDNDDLNVRIGLTEKQYMAALARIEKASVKAARGTETAFKRQNRQFQNTGRAAGSAASGGLRMASMQLSQVAQQGAATGDYMKALAIQVPDLALGFGALGIAAGAAVPILYSLFQGYMDNAEGAATLEDRLKGLAKAMDALEGANRRALTSPEDLVDTYGALAQEANRLFEIEKQIAQVRAQAAIGQAFGGITSAFGLGGVQDLDPRLLGDIGTSIDALTQRYADLRAEAELTGDAAAAALNEQAADAVGDLIAELEGVRGGLGTVRDQLGLTGDEAMRLAQMIAEVGAAEGPAAQAEAMQALADFIFEATGGLADADVATMTLYDSLLQAVSAALEFSAVDMTSPISQAISATDVLRARLAGLRGEMTTRLDNVAPDFFDPRNETGTSGQLPQDRPVPVENRPGYEPPKGRSGRRSGSGRSGGVSDAERQHNEYLRQAERLTRDLETATQTYNRELADLNRLHDLGYISADQHALATKRLRDEFEQVKFERLIDGIEDVSDAMADAIVQGDDLGDAFRGVLQQMASDLISSGIREGLTGLFGLGGGGGGGGLGGLIRGFFGGFRAEGGPVAAGTSYIVGERGPELFTPGRSGFITPNGGGGGGTSVVQVTLSPDLEARILQQARGTAVQIAGAGMRASRRNLVSGIQEANSRGV